MTNKQITRTKILRAIVKLSAKTKARPSAREIAGASPFQLSTVRKHLAEARAEGQVAASEIPSRGYVYRLAEGYVLPALPRKRRASATRKPATKPAKVATPNPRPEPVAPLTAPQVAQLPTPAPSPSDPRSLVLASLAQAAAGVFDLGRTTRLPRKRLLPLLDSLLAEGTLTKTRPAGRALYSLAS